MNLPMRQKQTHWQRNDTQFLVTKAESGAGTDRVFEITRYTLLYTKRINAKDLLHSTGDYIEYLVITCNGKESTYNIDYIKVIYITETNIRLQTNYMSIKSWEKKEVCMSVWMDVCVCVCVCVYIYVCIDVSTQTHFVNSNELWLLGKEEQVSYFFFFLPKI